jgi:hypothetical protein
MCIQHDAMIVIVKGEYILVDHIRPSLLARLPQIQNEIRSKIQRKKQLGGLLLINFWILSLPKAEENYLDLQNIMV